MEDRMSEQASVPSMDEVNEKLKEATGQVAEMTKAAGIQMPNMLGSAPMIPMMGAVTPAAGPMSQPTPPPDPTFDVDAVKSSAGPRSEPKQRPRVMVPDERPQGPTMVQLDPSSLLEIENLSLRMKLADSEERLATIALADARRKKEEMKRDEDQLLRKISQQLGRPINKSIRLVDKSKGLCTVE